MKKVHPTMSRIFELTKLDPSELADAINTSPQNVTNWSTRGISKKGAMDVSRVFGISVDWILTGTETEETSGYKDMMGLKTRIYKKMHVVDYLEPEKPKFEPQDFFIPILNWDTNGQWTWDDVFEYAYKTHNISEKGFALKVQGRSMAPEFNPEDIIYVETEIEIVDLKDADFVIVKREGEDDVTFKQLVIGEQFKNKYLKAYNPDWHDTEVIPLDDTYELIGKVVGKYTTYG